MTLNENSKTLDISGRTCQKTGASFAGKANDALSAAGSKISEFASTVREKAPRDGNVGSAAAKLANGLESSGNYLSDHGVEDIADEVTGLVKQYPIQSLCIGLGIGALLGAALSRR